MRIPKDIWTTRLLLSGLSENDLAKNWLPLHLIGSKQISQGLEEEFDLRRHANAEKAIIKKSICIASHRHPTVAATVHENPTRLQVRVDNLKGLSQMQGSDVLKHEQAKSKVELPLYLLRENPTEARILNV
jgi:hypothetical protein